LGLGASLQDVDKTGNNTENAVRKISNRLNFII